MVTLLVLVARCSAHSVDMVPVVEGAVDHVVEGHDGRRIQQITEADRLVVSIARHTSADRNVHFTPHTTGCPEVILLTLAAGSAFLAMLQVLDTVTSRRLAIWIVVKLTRAGA